MGNSKVWVGDMFAEVPALLTVEVVRLFVTSAAEKLAHSKVAKWTLPFVVPQVDPYRHLVP